MRDKRAVASGDVRERSDPSTQADPRLTLAYNEAQRAITQQIAHLANLRDRAGTLLSAAAVSASVFLAFSIRAGERPGSFTWAGVGMFAAVVSLIFRVLRPVIFAFELDAAALLRDYVDEGDSIDEMHRDLATHLASHFQSNKRVIDRLVVQYQLAIAGLGLEILMFVLDMRGRG